MQQRTEYIHLSWKDVHVATVALARALDKILAKEVEKPLLIPIARGGLIPAGILAYELACPIGGAICVTSYDNSNESGIPRIKEITYWPQAIHKRLIFIDDIIDSGNTIRALSQHFLQSRFVAPIGKPKGIERTQHLVPATPPLIIKDSQWVEFPWDSAKSCLTDRKGLVGHGRL